jgi:hypothetical protein
MPTLRPLRVPAFRRLATTYTLNELCYDFGAVALAIAVFEHTGSPLATTALFLSTTFAPALVAPALTARLDGLEIRRALGGLYALEAAIFVTLAVVMGRFALPVVLGLALVDGVLAITSRALTRACVVAALRPAGLLEAGNGLLNTLKSLCFAAAPVVAGGLIVVGGVVTSLLAAAALFAVMGATIALAPTLPAAPADAGTRWRARLGAALAHVREQPAVRRVIGAHALALTCLAAFTPVEIVYAKESLGGGSLTYGLILAAWGAGTITSSVLLARTARRPSALVSIPAAAATMAAGQLVMAVAPALPLAALGCLIAGAGNGVYGVSVIQAVQDHTSDELQARVAGLLESVTAAALGAGFVAGGACAALAGPRATLAASAAGALLAAASMLRWTRRPARDRLAPALNAA